MSSYTIGYYVVLIVLIGIWVAFASMIAQAARRKGRSGSAPLLINAILGLIGYFFWNIFFQMVAQPGQGNAGQLAAISFSMVFSLLISGIVTALQSRDESELIRRGIATGQYRKCPQCAEAIQKDALKCRFCGTTLPSVQPVDAPRSAEFGEVTK